MIALVWWTWKYIAGRNITQIQGKCVFISINLKVAVTLVIFANTLLNMFYIFMCLCVSMCMCKYTVYGYVQIYGSKNAFLT